MWKRNWIVAVLSVLILIGCVPNSTFEQTLTKQISAQELLVESSWYASNWRQDRDGTRSYPAGNDIENIHVTYRYADDVNNVSMHEVLRYKSIEEAKNDFEVRIKHMKSYNTEVFSPPNFQRISKYAQLAEVFCVKTTGNSRIMCIATMQYDRYISIFSAYINQNSMSELDFAHIIDKIDAKMAKLIS